MIDAIKNENAILLSSLALLASASNQSSDGVKKNYDKLIKLIYGKKINIQQEQKQKEKEEDLRKTFQELEDKLWQMNV